MSRILLFTVSCLACVVVCLGGHVALKSASSQVYFFLCRIANLGFQKRNCTLCALNFQTQFLIATFMTEFGQLHQRSGQVQCLGIHRIKFECSFFVKICVLSIYCCGAMRFIQFKSAHTFCILRFYFTNCVLVLRRNIFKAARPPLVLCQSIFI